MLAERLTAQGLAGPPLESPEAVAGRILAIQAQDGRGARLAVRARTSGLVATDVDRCLNEGTLVISSLNRGTLHLVRREDYPWLHAITAPRIVKSNQRRLLEEGVSEPAAEKGVEVIVAAIADRGPIDRSELSGALESAGVPTAGQAIYHVLMRATLLGLIVRGPIRDGRQCFVWVEDWLGPRQEIEIDSALAELARRYLIGHAPADERDLAKWAGITLGQARKGLRAIGRELDEADGLIRLKHPGRDFAPLPPSRLLGPFDPLLHGWASRKFLIQAERDRAVVTTNGIFHPTILVEGQVAGIWKRPGGKFELKPFGPLSAAESRELARDESDLTRFLEGVDD